MNGEIVEWLKEELKEVEGAFKDPTREVDWDLYLLGRVNAINRTLSKIEEFGKSESNKPVYMVKVGDMVVVYDDLVDDEYSYIVRAEDISDLKDCDFYHIKKIYKPNKDNTQYNLEWKE